MIEVYIDGASAGIVGPSGIGILIKGPNGVTEEFAIAIEATDNHQAEFIAAIEAMKLCLDRSFFSISLRTDSQIVDTALNSHYVKNPVYKQYLDEIVQLEARFDLFFVKWIPSGQNKKADQLAKSAVRRIKETENGK